MIDLILNDAGGLTLAHDEKALDGYDAIEIALADGTARLSGPAGERTIGRLQPEMLEFLRPGMVGRSVRFSGWSIARVAPLALRTVH